MVQRRSVLGPAHDKPLLRLVLEHDPVRYFPVAQLVLEQVEHAVLDVPEQPPLLYLPVPQVAQAEHEKPLVVPEHRLQVSRWLLSS